MTLKPAGDLALARTLLREQLGGEATDLSLLAGGQFSQAFSCTVGGRGYVLRLNDAAHAAEGFAKDDYAWRYFASPALPIPRVVATGRTAGGCFAISERAHGRTLDRLPPPVRAAVLPAALDTLDAIGRADVGTSAGYGPWDGAGRGRFTSWREALAELIENETAGFYRDWHALFRDSFLERGLYETLYRRMLQLAAACPEQRGLIHNDYHDENILADGRQITAVIDWAEAGYGDPLYDVAWIGWWAEIADPVLLRARYGTAPGYDERIACYSLHLGLNDLRYYARRGMRARYERGRARLLAVAAGDMDAALRLPVP